MRRSIRCGSVIALAFVIIVSVSCSSPKAERKKPPKAVKTVAFITNNSSDYWKAVRKGCEKADSELPDVKLNFQFAFGGQTFEQQTMINKVIEIDGADAV
ncbi:MAG: hypothetical protein J2P31_19395, partial [Blastocatellia bacterium]|nr:hypothetical protein [Blastocatellia bacterium]